MVTHECCAVIGFLVLLIDSVDTVGNSLGHCAKHIPIVLLAIYGTAISTDHPNDVFLVPESMANSAAVLIATGRVKDDISRGLPAAPVPGHIDAPCRQ